MQRSSGAPWLLALIALVLVGVGFFASGAFKSAGAPEDTRSSKAKAHATAEPCASCHKAPSKSHFAGDCARCHDRSRPFSKPQLSHVTFGAHMQATQDCDSCHRATKPGQPACRTCHGSRCGKDSKTIGDCVKCHESGVTRAWIPQP